MRKKFVALSCILFFLQGQLLAALSQAPRRGEVLKITRGLTTTVEISLGARDGIQVGMTGKIYAQRATLGLEAKNLIAVLKVTQVLPESSLGQLVSLIGEVEVGYLVEIEAGPAVAVKKKGKSALWIILGILGAGAIGGVAAAGGGGGGGPSTGAIRIAVPNP